MSNKPREHSLLEETLGHRFRRQQLLESALTHASHAHESGVRGEGEVRGTAPARGGDPDLAPGESDNERLEFLGDAVLALVAAEELVRRFPGYAEGHLSKLRAHLVSQRHLARVAEGLQLGAYLRLGRGEEKSGGRSKAALLVDALEAVIGALYLDGGLDLARSFVLGQVLGPELEKGASAADPWAASDYKSSLQELAHTLGRAQPSYVLVGEEGPQHQKLFTVEVRLHRSSRRGRAEYVARAKGPTKKAAEQNAAQDALGYLRSIASPAGSGTQSTAARRASTRAASPATGKPTQDAATL